MKRILLLALCLHFFLGCGEDKQAEPAPPENSTVVQPNAAITTGPVQKRTISHTIPCTGKIDLPPAERISVHARTAGQVSGLRLVAGDYVRRGAQLCRIANPELIPLQRQLLEARARLKTAEQALDRQRILQAGEATTTAALENAAGEVNLLTATYSGLKSELRQYGVNVKELEANGTYQSSVGVYASAAGFVHEITVNEGRRITPTDQLMEIAGTDHLHLELQVPTREINRLQQGQTVTYRLPFAGKAGTATVAKINPMVEESSATLQVHCHFADKEREHLLPGLFVNATILTGNREAHGLPRSAVIKEGETYYGFRFTDGEYRKTELQGVNVTDDFVAFANFGDGEWVTGGAYYLGE